MIFFSGGSKDGLMRTEEGAHMSVRDEEMNGMIKNKTRRHPGMDQPCLLSVNDK